MEVPVSYNGKPAGDQSEQLSPDELAQFRAWKAENAERLERDKTLSSYRALVDETIENLIPRLVEVSNSMKELKKLAFEEFQNAIEMKKSLFDLKGETEQKSYTFSNSTSTKRIQIGYYTIDAWADTVNEGVDIVMEWLKDLGSNDKEKALIRAVTRLLSRSANGNLNAKKVMELRSTVGDIATKRVLEGIELIEKSYQPERSKTYMRVEVKNEDGQWENIPLNITEV